MGQSSVPVGTLEQALADARRALADRLNQSVRRLRRFENEAQWGRALVDAAAPFCDRAALFAVNGPRLELRAGRNLSSEAMQPVPLQDAPAFQSAVDSKDTVVTIRSA